MSIQPCVVRAGDELAGAGYLRVRRRSLHRSLHRRLRFAARLRFLLRAHPPASGKAGAKAEQQRKNDRCSTGDKGLFLFRTQVFQQLVRRGIPVPCAEFEAFFYYPPHWAAYLGPRGVWLSLRRLVERCAQGVYVTFRPGLTKAVLLRRGVAVGAEGNGIRVSLRLKETGSVEIYQHIPAAIGAYYVFRLYVPVYYGRAAAVQQSKGGAYIYGEPPELILAKPSVIQRPSQRNAVDIPLGHHRPLIVLPYGYHLGQPRAVQTHEGRVQRHGGAAYPALGSAYPSVGSVYERERAFCGKIVLKRHRVSSFISKSRSLHRLSPMPLSRAKISAPSR